MSLETSKLKNKIIQALKEIYDPEMPINIYDLGLIYNIELKLNKKKYDCNILMTLTSPNCPVAESLPQQVHLTISQISEINDCFVSLTFDPPWDKSNLSDEAKLDLGLF